MKMTKVCLISLTIIVALLSIMLSGCSVLNPERLISVTEHGYDINPETLLGDLSRGNLLAFEEFSPPLELRNRQDIAVEWRESDYFTIADSVIQIEKEESISEWQIYQLVLLANCNQISSGPYFSYVKFDFQKLEEVSNSRERYKYEISVIPRENQVYTRMETYFPNWDSPKAITIDNLKITGEKALTITELNGGMNVRERVDNQCTVSMLFFPDGLGYPGWQIHYHQSDVKRPDYAMFWIDPESGEIVRKAFLEP